MRRKVASKFKILSKQLIHRGRVFKLKKVNLCAPDGRRFQHDVIYHPGAAVIVPVLKTGEFVLVRQYRTATNKMLLEFPAGTLEEGEAPLECAKREIVEEINYEAKQWKKLVTFYPAPGISSELMHVFLASDLRSKHGIVDKDEFLKPRIVTYQGLRKMILTGKILDAKTIIGFFYYGCYRKRK